MPPRRSRLALLAVALLALTAGFAWAGPAPSPMPVPPRPNIGGAVIRVVVNGTVVPFDVPPQMAEGTVFVPLRGVFEQIGATVNFDKSSGQITATRGETTVALKVGTKLAKVNDENMFMVQPAVYLNGRTLVPLRFLTEALGAEVEWNPALREVDITAEAVPAAARPKKETPHGK